MEGNHGVRDVAENSGETGMADKVAWNREAVNSVAPVDVEVYLEQLKGVEGQKLRTVKSGLDVARVAVFAPELAMQSRRSAIQGRHWREAVQ